jgi:hypothetical protein
LSNLGVTQKQKTITASEEALKALGFEEVWMENATNLGKPVVYQMGVFTALNGRWLSRQPGTVADLSEFMLASTAKLIFGDGHAELMRQLKPEVAPEDAIWTVSGETALNIANEMHGRGETAWLEDTGFDAIVELEEKDVKELTFTLNAPQLYHAVIRASANSPVGLLRGNAANVTNYPYSIWALMHEAYPNMSVDGVNFWLEFANGYSHTQLGSPYNTRFWTPLLPADLYEQHAPNIVHAPMQFAKGIANVVNRIKLLSDAGDAWAKLLFNQIMFYPLQLGYYDVAFSYDLLQRMLPGTLILQAAKTGDNIGKYMRDLICKLGDPAHYGVNAVHFGWDDKGNFAAILMAAKTATPMYVDPDEMTEAEVKNGSQYLKDADAEVRRLLREAIYAMY